MKAWRRSSTDRGVDVTVVSAPTLLAVGGEVVEASGLHIGEGYNALRTEVGPGPGGPFGPLGVDVLVSDPQNIDAAGHLGEWLRARVEGTGLPDSEWAVPVEIIA